MLDASLADRVTVRFLPLPEALRPYISTIYLTEIDLPGGKTITDWMLPEWASIRLAQSGGCLVGQGADPLQLAPRMMVMGPTSHALKVEIGSAQVWGLGILPLGWARLLGLSAADYANRITDAEADPALAALVAALAPVLTSNSDLQATGAAIASQLEMLLQSRPPIEDEGRIRAAHQLLIDEDIGAVSDLAERLGMSPRTLERFCGKVFGFSPKLLLRRQRFTRSLSQFLLDPSLKWINTLDFHYVDQAHFVRDFRWFMGMSPSAYAAADKPILRVAAHARNVAVGGAVQALHQP